MGNETKAAYYSNIAKKWKEAVEMVLWHEEVGAWLDYDILNDIKRDYFYPTNILPLWTDCYDTSKRTDYVSKVLKYLEKHQIMLNHGGIPTTLEHSGEQWDYPNAWPPLQYFFIMSLNNTGDAWAQRLAYEISQRWVRSNYKAFNETHCMYEKVTLRKSETTPIVSLKLKEYGMIRMMFYRIFFFFKFCIIFYNLSDRNFFPR